MIQWTSNPPRARTPPPPASPTRAPPRPPPPCWPRAPAFAQTPTANSLASRPFHSQRRPHSSCPRGRDRRRDRRLQHRGQTPRGRLPHGPRARRKARKGASQKPRVRPAVSDESGGKRRRQTPPKERMRGRINNQRLNVGPVSTLSSSPPLLAPWVPCLPESSPYSMRHAFTFDSSFSSART